MIRETLAVGLLGCNCTVLGDEESHEAIVVDPGYDIPRILAVLAKHQLTVKQIVVTHAHIDHIASALDLKQITGAPILYSQADLPLVAMMDMQAGWLNLAVPKVMPPDHSPEDGEQVSVRGIDATVLHTPGHTEGSLCLHVPAANLLLAGDTLFAGGVGRTDLPGGNTEKLLGSIRERLLPLPDATQVIPGHGPATTIARERATNPFLI
ncbi:MBL fold metallo-hydrolase [Granulicella sp. S156]|uniref:MBL fold metallo-hydrolase n=1 Tax=Granulicella sp. S156 TaxID=1747224 RepID=UPI00131A9365|nr:MBL fold metallo-hydrolase [Granulicella sp. S156]